MISNPPLRRTSDSEPALIALHSSLPYHENQFGGWNLSLFSAARSAGQPANYVPTNSRSQEWPAGLRAENYHIAETTADSKPATVAEDYANRLRKNLKKLEKWARQKGIECYRLYDADLPEYNVAVDRYATGR